MKKKNNYLFKDSGIIIKATSEQEARKLFNQYLHDSTDVGVAEFLKRKGIKFSKVDGTGDKIVVKFDNEKDWTIATKELRRKYKDIESIKQGNSHKVIIGDSFVGDVNPKDIEKYLESNFNKNEKNLDKLFKDLKSKFNRVDKDTIDYVVSGFLSYDWNDSVYDKALNKYFKDTFITDIKASDYTDYAWKIENGDLAREVFHSMLRDGKTFEEAKKQHENICRVIESQIVKKVEKSKNIFNGMKKEYEEMYNKHHSKK